MIQKNLRPPCTGRRSYTVVVTWIHGFVRALERTEKDAWSTMYVPRPGFLIRSYGAPNGPGRCSVAQCYGIGVK